MSQVKSFRDVRDRFRANWVGYVQEYRVLLILAVLASLADAASTVRFMVLAGPLAESHPAVRTVSEIFGPILGPILGKTIQFLTLIGVTVYLRRWATVIFIPTIILYAWAAWYNVWGHQWYYPRLVQWLDFLAI